MLKKDLLTCFEPIKIIWCFFILFMLQIGGGQNFNEHLLKVIEQLIKESREARLQPFNEYRKKFQLKPYTAFNELTGK